ncbi:uncharacterized protein F4822DRAFT_444629 [Hypoxylon trugodes]|uniref:uncharacterized protein n=1 Tax=Hypoxylon trugodes TaxID=326681 RepID=UPI002193B283|nr:uncharacterized protein F4822DRAFT_444629 [Hypoxylon trugodes]KAI1386122.1 hypothetical protein F4822DRAFT_444629 [Hypoxylon trugodes]
MGRFQILLLIYFLFAPSWAADICSTNAVFSSIPYFKTPESSLSLASSCGAHCSSDEKCASYAIGEGLCLHFKEAVEKITTTASLSPIEFFDKGCHSSKYSDAEKFVLNKTSIANDARSIFMTPSVLITNSSFSPLVEASFLLDDKTPATTQKYADEPLLTVVARDSQKARSVHAADFYDSTCILDPSKPEEKFNILGSNFIPLINQDGNTLRPLPAPTSEAEANAMGPPWEYALPEFFFQKPENAEGEIYDIVLTGATPQYVAKTAEGAVVLTDASTGTTPVNRNGQDIITSIFGVDCKGRITVTQDGSRYTWDVSAGGGSTAFTAGLDASNRSMVAYPLKMRPKNRGSSRRSQYTEGAAPRCPNNPPGLVSRVFPGARPLEPNGCGTPSTIHLIPDLTFGDCCNDHDNCYDNCEDSWESCNNKFHKCMRGPGCEYFNHWYSYLVYVICLNIADFYAWVVSQEPGRQAFISSTHDRCGCYCPESAGLCGRADRDNKCISMFGSDVRNCGACGKECPSKAICNSGNCTCPADECDGQCISLQTNPNNCGTCGNKCSTGYCLDGQCTDPPTDKCAPLQAFPNGDFSNGGEGWRTCEIPGCGGYVDFSGQTAYINMLNMPGDVSLDLKTEVNLCPRQAYDLSFTLGLLSGGGTCQFKYTFGSQDWSIGYNFPKVNSNSSMGPFDIPAQGLEDGDGSDTSIFRMEFTALISCVGGPVEIIVDDFNLVPSH